MIFKNFLKKCKLILILFKKVLGSNPILLVDNKLESHLLFEVEQPFNRLYEAGMQLSNTPDRGNKRRARFYNLINFLKTVNHLEGAIVECGCWKGLSSYLMCNYLSQYDPNFTGKDFFIIDSFEGLSEPRPEDVIKDSLVDQVGERKGSYFKSAGAYSAQMEDVKKVLSKFPEVTFQKGWIPETLNILPEKTWKFVHIDVDLYDPILGALEYFYSKLVKGGIMICDDYGSLYWPGAKKAVEEFAHNHKLQFISLSSGQAVFIKQ